MSKSPFFCAYLSVLIIIKIMRSLKTRKTEPQIQVFYTQFEARYNQMINESDSCPAMQIHGQLHELQSHCFFCLYFILRSARSSHLHKPDDLLQAASRFCSSANLIFAFFSLSKIGKIRAVDDISLVNVIFNAYRILEDHISII